MNCPNCLTPSKCNGPHLLMLSQYHYKSIDGYYIQENGVWKFFPFEKGLDSEELTNISSTLSYLNETKDHYEY